MNADKNFIKKFAYRIPSVIKHKETKAMMRGVVAELSARGALTAADLPMLNRLATSYDRYWEAVTYLSTHSLVDINKKGEEVKHPMVNIEREAWTQFLTVAKEYGLTKRSGVQISGKMPQKPNDDDVPGKKWFE